MCAGFQPDGCSTRPLPLAWDWPALLGSRCGMVARSSAPSTSTHASHGSGPMRTLRWPWSWPTWRPATCSTSPKLHDQADAVVAGVSAHELVGVIDRDRFPRATPRAVGSAAFISIALPIYGYAK